MKNLILLLTTLITQMIKYFIFIKYCTLSERMHVIKGKIYG